MWHAITGRPNSLFPQLPWTPALELRVAHARWDQPGGHPAVPGFFRDRHIAPGRRLPLPLTTRDAVDLGTDLATGLGVSAASGPDGDLRLPGDTRTRHQLDWDFLAMHLRRAIARQEAALPLPALKDWQDEQAGPDPLRDWRICNAITRYVLEWKNRLAGRPCPSPHPVDVLLASHHCGGTANAACALAQVAGIPARRISTSTHSTVEFLVGGRWLWSDNIRCGLTLHSGSYQDFLAHFDQWPNVSAAQRQQHAKHEVFYRAPYDYSASLGWRFGSGCPVPACGGHGDAAAGFGLTVHHDPATAAALYPGQSGHLCAGDAGDRPWLSLGAKGGWLSAALPLNEGLALRRRFFISACEDNPLQAAELRAWCLGDGGGLAASLDGVALSSIGRQPQRHVHQVAVFAVPSMLLTPGWHEAVLHGRGCAVAFPEVLLDPDPAASAAIALDPTGITTDPVHFP